MNPTRFLAASVCGFFLAACAGLPAQGTPSTDRPPNVILVLTDDLGYGDIGANGSTVIQTPVLDRLAAEGVRLTSFYAAANVCTPSRAGLLTGRYPVRMGLANGVVLPQSTHGLPPSEITLAELLRGSGYRTAMIGKWHLGHLPEFWPTEHGFDTFFGVRYSNDMEPFGLYDQSALIEEPVDQTSLTRRYTERAVDVIEQEGEAPFFLYLAHTFPHIPLFSEPPFEGASAAGAYGDTVETIDWSMGEIVKALQRTGQTENTLIIFTSDNGPWFEGSSGNSRDRKGGTWEGGYRVPFIAWWPGTLPAGSVNDAPVSALDILPTVAGLVGAETGSEPVTEIDGRDIWPVLHRGAPSPHDYLLFFDEDQIAAVRSGDWRLVLRSYYKTYNVPLDIFSYPLLFNLSTDPAEAYSLTDREPDEVKRLHAIVDREINLLGIVPKSTIPGVETEAE